MGKEPNLHKFTVYITKEEEGGFSGQCAELPSAISQGETLKELQENMIDAIQLVLESIRAEAEAKANEPMVLEVPL